MNEFNLSIWFGSTTGLSNGSTTQLFGPLALGKSLAKPHLQEVGPCARPKIEKVGFAMGNCNKYPAHLKEVPPGKYCMGEFILSQYPTQPAASSLRVPGKTGFLQGRISVQGILYKQVTKLAQCTAQHSANQRTRITRNRKATCGLVHR